MEAVSSESLEQAQAIFGTNRPDIQTSKGESLDVEAYLKQYGHEIERVKQNGGSTLYCLKECVFDPSHAPNEAAIGTTSEGKLFYQCFHNGCQGHTWAEAREKISGKNSLKQFMPNVVGKIEDKVKTSSQPSEPTLPLWEQIPTAETLQNLTIQVEYVVEGLIPKHSITTLAGKGGTGKTYLVMCLMDAVTKSEPFLGIATQQTDALLVDFENSLPVVVERLRTLNITKVKILHSGMNPSPPRIDSPEYKQYLNIPPCLIVFDSLRACQSGDENSSKDMALVMERFKELRDYGHTIIIIQHTQKANERMFRGSMAISDQADHPLYFYPVRNTKSDEAVDDDDDFDNLPFYLGTTEKTRYKHFKIYVRRAGNGRFVVADDPKTEKMRAIWKLCKDRGPMKHEEIVTLVNEELGFGKDTIRKLLKDGTGKFWTWKKGETKNSKIYHFTSPLTPPPLYRGEWISEQDSGSSPVHYDDFEEKHEEKVDDTKFTDSSERKQRTGEQDFDDDFIHEEDDYPLEPPRFKGGAV